MAAAGLAGCVTRGGKRAPLEQVLDRLQGLGLVVFDREQVVGALLVDEDGVDPVWWTSVDGQDAQETMFIDEREEAPVPGRVPPSSDRVGAAQPRQVDP
jgi:hypothetical protein